MQKNGKTRWILAASLAILGTAAPASADNTTCANAQFVNMGQTIDDLLTPAIDDRWYQVHLRAGHSYAFMAWAPFTDPSVESASIDMAATLNDCVTAQPFTGSFGDLDTTIHNGDGNTLIPSATGDYRIHVFAVGATTNSHTVVMQVVETTLYSPYWQVAAGAGYDAAPQLANADESSSAATLTLFNSVGIQVCQTTRNINGNGMATFSIASECGVINGFGSARIAHNGPPGTLVGNITTFSANSGLSFDAPFFPLQQYSAASNLR